MMRAMDSTDLFLSSQGILPAQHERTPGSHSRSVLLCAAACLGLFCVGYDQAMASRIVQSESFERKFCADCSQSPTPAHWDSFLYWFSTISTIGYILGAFAAALLADRAGRKWAIFAGTLVFTLGTLWVTLSPALDVMLGGRVFQGIGGGMYLFVLPIYCVEVATRESRGMLAGVAQLVLGLGFFTGAYVESRYTDVSWQLLYYAPLFPGALLAIASIFLPESPRWVHLHKGKELAEISLKRIRNTFIVQHELDAIATQVSTIADMPGWHTLANFSILRRIAIATMLQIFQLLFTLTVTTSFESLMEMKEPETFSSSIFDDYHFVLFIVNVASALPALYLVDAAGRRQLLVFGALGMVLAHSIIGISISMDCDAEIYGRTCTQKSAVGVFVGTALLVLSNTTCWMPVVWLYPAELFPTNVRAKATAIAAVLSGASVFWARELFPKLIEFSVVSIVLCALALLLVATMCCETKCLLLEDTEELFEHGFPSKKHRNTMSDEVTVPGHPLQAA